jgi:thiol-disulfide isomerase/thioredoxin
MAEGEQPASAPGTARPGWVFRLLVAALLVVLVANLVILLRAPGRARLDPGGAPAPPFSGRLTDGRTTRLEDYRSQVVLLDFWATWCAPCIYEMPVLERVHRRFAGAGRPFTLLGINAEGHDISADRVAAFARGKGLSYPIVVDDGTIAERYEVDSIPHMVLIDGIGRVRRTYQGAVPEEKLAADIEALLR